MKQLIFIIILLLGIAACVYAGCLCVGNLEIEYDGSNQATFTVGAGGDLIITPSGGGTNFIGEVDIVHTSTEADDHAFEIDVDAAGYGDVKAIDIAYVTGAISAGEDEGIILLNINEIAATGGDVFGFEVLATDGSAGIYGLKAGALVGPIHQDSGTFANPTTGTDNTVSTDVSAMIDGDPCTTTAIFENDNEYILIGAAAAFEEIEFILDTDASGAGIKPTFGYSISGSHQFTAFTPVDGTNGFRNTGVIAWDASDLTNHVANDDTGTFDIKITRTKNSLTTTPVLGYAKTAATTEYIWDKNGNLNINDLTVDGSATITGTATINKVNLGGGITAFVLNGVSLNAIVGATSQIATELQYLALQHSNVALAGSRFMLSRSRGTLANPLIVVENDSLAAFDAAAYDGTDYVLAGEIDFEVDGEPGGNDMPGRIVFKTTADGGILPAEKWTIKSTGDLLSGTDGTGAYDISTAGTITGAGIVANTIRSDGPLQDLIAYVPDPCDPCSVTLEAFRLDASDSRLIFDTDLAIPWMRDGLYLGSALTDGHLLSRASAGASSLSTYIGNAKIVVENSSPTLNALTVTSVTDGTATLTGGAWDTLTVSNAAVIGANSAVFQPGTDATTFFQVLDADGGTPVLNVDSTNERVGIGTAAPKAPFHVVGVLGVESKALEIPSGFASKGVFLKFNSAVDYGSLWSYDYSATAYKGLEIDTNYTLFQIDGATKAQLQSTGIFDVDEFADIQTTNANTKNSIGRCQIGTTSDYALFGYRECGLTKYAILQTPAWATVVKSASGQSTTFYPGNALALTLESDQDALFEQDLAVKANTTLGDASTDTITATGRLVLRDLGGDPSAGGGMAGTRGEIAYDSANEKVWLKTVDTGTNTNWVALN
jgi:hypothetical protein